MTRIFWLVVVLLTTWFLTAQGEAEGQARTVFSPQTFQVGPGKTEFQRESDKPIHLGDNWGNIADITPEQRDSNAPTAYGWRFSVSTPPKAARLTVSVFSVAEPRLGCYTKVFLNGKSLANLSHETPVGSGVTTTKVMSLGSEAFRSGENELVISEEQCVGPYKRPEWNDSLVREVRLEVD